MSLRFVVGADARPPRVAYAVGRAAGTAVARNRVRRRLRAAVAGHVDELVPGGAYLFAAGRDVLTMPFADLDRGVARLLRTARPGRRGAP